MGFIACSLIILAMVSGSGLCKEKQDLAAQVLDQVEKKYSGASFLTQFSQISTLKALDITETASGKAWFSHPGRMRWQYLTPDHHEIITNGQRVWIFRPQEKQVMTGDAQGFFQAGAGGTFLSDISLIRKNHRISVHKTDPTWVELKLKAQPPKVEDSQAISSIIIRVSRKSHEITRVTTVNPHGDATLFEFSQIRFTPLEPAQFEFTIPEGTSIIEMD